MVAPRSPLTDAAVRKVAAHPSEASGHWYDEHGQQIAEVTGAKGQPVRPDLRHARKLQLCRGVTSIIGMAAAPQLELWKRRQSILAALTLPRGETESEGDWLRRVEEDAKETASKAAEEGTRIHAAIQSQIQGKPLDPNYLPHVTGALAALDTACGFQAWRSEVACIAPIGVGTKADLVSDEFLVDFKGVDATAAEIVARETYDVHAMQLGATRYALGNMKLRCGICFVSRNVPGVAHFVEVEEKALVRGLAMFRALLRFSQASDGYRPEWVTEDP